MRILMLGWEFPPFISGGLGTACYGLTRALDRLGHQVIFVLPKPVDRSQSSHIRLLSPDGPIAAMSGNASGDAAPMPRRAHGAPQGDSPSDEFALREGLVEGDDLDAELGYSMPGFEHTRFRSVPATFSSPYPSFQSRTERWFALGETPSAGAGTIDPRTGEILAGDVSPIEVASLAAAGVSIEPGAPMYQPAPLASGGTPAGGAGVAYEGDMLQNAERYARLVVALARREKFDVVHAHDWMTFPAGQAVAQATGKPLVVHVHSTEFDRAGEHPNQRVYDIERRGMHAALRVVAVSNLTASICTRRYGIDPAKLDVVWNGIDSDAAQPKADTPGIGAKDRIVLFLGRITMQKGPEYFIRSAKRVLEKVPNAKFVVAGSGDMATRMIEEAAELGIGHKVTFTGFLRGKDVDRVFQMADCYVMPSVSEPFGIAPLEAMRNDVPVIISKQSGVSEALTHALKVDFWDIDEMANKIVAVLRHPPLGATLREHGAFELRKLTWEGAGIKCVESYQKAMTAQGR